MMGRNLERDAQAARTQYYGGVVDAGIHVLMETYLVPVLPAGYKVKPPPDPVQGVLDFGGEMLVGLLEVEHADPVNQSAKQVTAVDWAEPGADHTAMAVCRAEPGSCWTEGGVPAGTKITVEGNWQTAKFMGRWAGDPTGQTPCAVEVRYPAKANQVDACAEACKIVEAGRCKACDPSKCDGPRTCGPENHLPEGGSTSDSWTKLDGDMAAINAGRVWVDKPIQPKKDNNAGAAFAGWYPADPGIEDRACNYMGEPVFAKALDQLPVLEQVYMDILIGRLDRVLSELMDLSKVPGLDRPNRQTLKHHIEDMELCAQSIRDRLKLGPNSQLQQDDAAKVLADISEAFGYAKPMDGKTLVDAAVRLRNKLVADGVAVQELRTKEAGLLDRLAERANDLNQLRADIAKLREDNQRQADQAAVRARELNQLKVSAMASDHTGTGGQLSVPSDAPVQDVIAHYLACNPNVAVPARVFAHYLQSLVDAAMAASCNSPRD